MAVTLRKHQPGATSSTANRGRLRPLPYACGWEGGGVRAQMLVRSSAREGKRHPNFQRFMCDVVWPS